MKKYFLKGININALSKVLYLALILSLQIKRKKLNNIGLFRA